MPDLSGRTAVVTGGGSGIGAATAAMLASYGARVAVGDVSADAGAATVARIADAGGTAVAVEHDVRSLESGRRMVTAVEDALGPIDILVNNAGVSRRVPFLELDEREWDRLMDINVKGVLFTTQAVLPGMVERGWGRVLNMSSVVGKEAYPGFLHYCTSKFAIIGMTQGIAKEFALTGVTVNAVCPGIVETPLHDGVVAQMAEGAGVSRERAWEDFLGSVPMGRPQTPEDVAEMISFLASDKARNITGSAFNVAGGMEVR
ncbi:SDR family NAD(P)-dependent oxidoreductase [Microbacterium pseudoresistens]|uniref:NAD(P)-dependent dehydrogenase (Short-subunit alcohol dehydrogenase family) n=1 Tax=Microbacterium pseudoresistens TaxID=640634 RepID=A0A7Y9JNJ4_9MICO|nr:SDR family NAD(P)-dependent oxidoreductase [Microbacterium pseudoresistens]NYD53769.1 NAD(P)-dependent dehydrogenase (short-subunit alcohol dehydrogenase family) [Microbacterium pseudoresistens]